MEVRTIILNPQRNVILTAYLQPVGMEYPHISKRPGILILPGGGYQICSEREADPVAAPFLGAGYHVFILRYSLGVDAQWPNPLCDYEMAMDCLRENAEMWKLYADKIAVIGFSAGGHLAACAATMSQNRPNAAILGYAVLQEASAKQWLASAPDVISAVDEKTCPCFLFATRNDNVVSVENTVSMMQALIKHGITFESHIYGYGPHGFSTGADFVVSPGFPYCARIAHWVPDCIAWLGDVLGSFGPNGFTEPCCGTHVDSQRDNSSICPEDHAPYLSVDCSIGHLMQNPTAQCIIHDIMGGGETQSTTEQKPAPNQMVAGMTLRYALKRSNAPEQIIQMLDHKLRQIPNSAT